MAWANLLFHCGLFVLTATLSLSYLESSALRWRLAAFLIAAGNAYLAILHVHCLPDVMGLRFYFCIYMFGIILYSNYHLVIVRTTAPEHMQGLARLIWSFGVTFNPRGFAAPWRIRDLSSSKSDSNVIPTSREFLCKRILTIGCFCAANSLLDLAYEFLPVHRDDFVSSEGQISEIIMTITSRKLLVRFYIGFYNALLPWIFESVLHGVFAVVAVLFGSPPEQWPPLFGDIGEAYTVRRFWGYVSSIP